MKLETDGGKLKLVSAYKMIFFAWIIGIGGFFMLIFIPMALAMTLSAFLGGSGVHVNGETVTGSAAIAPMFMMLVMMPLIITFHAAMFGGLLTIGLLIYRQFKPIEVIETRSATRE